MGHDINVDGVATRKPTAMPKSTSMVMFQLKRMEGNKERTTTRIITTVTTTKIWETTKVIPRDLQLLWKIWS